MRLTSFTRVVLAVVCLLCVAGSVRCMAQSKPLWVQHGEKSMNNKRHSDNYTFKVFNTHNAEKNSVMAKRYEPLLTYVRELYGVKPLDMAMDTTAVASDGSKAIKISFPEGDSTAVVYAKLVDDYIEFEDYQFNVFQFELYQLYAVTDKNAVPVFDDFEVVETSNAKALSLSIIPGMGQFYKGHITKGWVMLGGEAALLSTALVCHSRYNKYDKKDWDSKATSWRQMRNISLGLACGLYIYNLIDAATTKGGSSVKVKKSANGNLAVAPWVNDDGAGLSFVLKL